MYVVLLFTRLFSSCFLFILSVLPQWLISAGPLLGSFPERNNVAAAVAAAATHHNVSKIFHPFFRRRPLFSTRPTRCHPLWFHLSLTAFKIFIAAYHTSSDKPLSSIPNHSTANSPHRNRFYVQRINYVWANRFFLWHHSFPSLTIFASLRHGERRITISINSDYCHQETRHHRIADEPLLHQLCHGNEGHIRKSLSPSVFSHVEKPVFHFLRKSTPHFSTNHWIQIKHSLTFQICE